MTGTIVGALTVKHAVDQNGSLSIDVPLQLPQAKFMPEISLSYHSAVKSPSPVGIGWVLKGASIIERVPATIAQDDFRGVVNYDKNDRFCLDGQRLMRLTPTGNEYRFEVEQWSKVIAQGSDLANPDSWIQLLPNGTKRRFGATADSNIKAQGTLKTRAWAVSEHSDAFTNYVSFAYDNDTANGSFYLSNVSYGGNRDVNMAHQRKIYLEYEGRSDKQTWYQGGYKICIDKRLVSIASSVEGNHIHTHLLQYDVGPLTATSRLREVTLADSTAATVAPLKFHWNDGNPSVFDSVQDIANIDVGTLKPQIMPMDVYASGKSDFVLASKRLDPNRGFACVYLEVYRADEQGGLSTSPAPGYGSTGLRYSDKTQLIPFDATGDGRTDLLHIDFSLNSNHTLTILKSTDDGFISEKNPLTFTSEASNGRFYSGDFDGSGNVGLVYIYQSGNQIKFVQFTSDGSQFTASSPREGPYGYSLTTAQIIVGNLKGKSADDIFIGHPKLTGANGRVCHIDLIESVNGTLSYRDDEPLVNSGESVSWTDSTQLLPFSTDEDSKTSLLIISKTIDGYLQWQLLRSTGSSFLSSPPPTLTPIPFRGDIALARPSSTFGIDLVNTFHDRSNVQISIFQFDGEGFTPLSPVQRPGDFSSDAIVRWADLRGIGRTDCTVNVFNVSTGKLSVKSLPCSSSQPVDFISKIENGMGATTSVLYSSLSDKSTYTATDTASRIPAAAVNALAHNSVSNISLSSSDVQLIGHTRTEIVHFPAMVVKTLTSFPRATNPDVSEVQDYQYTDAKVSFDGRGWLGFSSVSKTLSPLGVREMTCYHQVFPLLGQPSQAVTKEAAGSNVLQMNEYSWKPISVSGKIQALVIQSSQETYYEAGVKAFSTEISYTYDSYANAIQMVITSSQPNVPSLTIGSTYDNDEQSWVIGNKTLHSVIQGSATLKNTKYTYVPGTRISSSTSKWVAGSTWSTQSFDFDRTGNEIAINGPGPTKCLLTYDATYSHVISTTTFTQADSITALTETATFDLALGKPLSVQDPNGHIIAHTYDLLGRVLDVSEGDDLSTMTVMERSSYNFNGVDHFHSRKISNHSGPESSWPRSNTYFDGNLQKLKVERSSPEDPTVMIASEVKYDGAGRVTARSRDHFSGSTPVFATFSYDSRSRVLQEVSPAVAEGAAPLTTTFQYQFESGVGKLTETRSDGQTHAEVIKRELLYLPNPEPTLGHITKPFVTSMTSELSQTIRTQFDGLGRSTSVKDDSNMELALGWDGLSRPTERRLLGSEAIHSHFTVQYDDTLLRSTVLNKLTGTQVITQNDFIQRPIWRLTPEEKITFTYDVGGQFSKQRLVDITSSKGISQHYDYDSQGHLITAYLSIDGHDFTTSNEWTFTGQLAKTVNPDGTSITRSFLADGQTLRRIQLADSSGGTRASIELSSYNNVFSRPLVCEFGNGIKSSSSVAAGGGLTNTTMSQGIDVIHQQDWTIDSFSRIGKYGVTGSGSQLISTSTFGYDLAGQLVNCNQNDSQANSESFSYDLSGNLCTKNGKTFKHDGWQLTSVQDEYGATESVLEYSVGGNLTTKRDGVGTPTSTMKYDSMDRLVELDGTVFVYDYSGRLIKTVSPSSDVTIYPTQTYEFSISPEATTHTAYLFHGYRCASLTVAEGESYMGTVHYFHTDHLGSTIGASDENGELITQYQYDSFGKVTVQGPDVARYKFSGKEQFRSVYYFGARFYDPDTGRFLTLDNYPTSLHQIRPCTFNMYAFARNDPINFIDVNGNVPWWHWLVDALAIVGGIACMFIPVPYLNTIASGTLLGFGMNGLSYDIAAANSGQCNDREWGIQLGIGAGIGFVTGCFGAVVDFAVPAASFADAVSSGTAKQLVGRAAVRVALGSVSGSAGGVLGQVFNNLREGKPLDEGLLEAAWIGAVGSFATGAFGEAVSFAPYNPAKLWKGKFRGYTARGVEPNVEILPGMWGKVEVPLRQLSKKEAQAAASKVTLVRYNPGEFDSAGFNAATWQNAESPRAVRRPNTSHYSMDLWLGQT